MTFFTPVQERIEQVEARLRLQSAAVHPDLSAALDHLLSSGGKRVRPAVALLTGSMLGAEPDRLITLGAAIELLHTATLVHDDLIDGSLLRRGAATLNSRWTPAATVLTGDYIFAQAARLAAETDSIPVMQLFAETLAILVSGEIHQHFDGHNGVDRDGYFERIYAKTASMFELAAGAAALLSPVDSAAVATARSFGRDLGIAFQIVDDVLDFTGDQSVVGKPVANDLRQGLVTLPVLYFSEKNPDDPDLGAVLSGNRYDGERIERVIREIQASDAIELSLNEARKFVERGLEFLQEFPPSMEREALEDLALYIVNRHR